MANALASETSPYLLQHRDNPVDWMPWGEEALRRARDEDKPILVSIGYSACHWCHVMERESFEDDDTAAVMNEHFVCVKVDREERPDVDAIYMEAVQAMTGHGGWPLNVFVTPEQVPFYGGTYFPPEPRMNMPSWRQVLLAVADAWTTRRDEIREQGERLAAAARRRRPAAARRRTRSIPRRSTPRSRSCAGCTTASRAASAARRSSRRPRRSSSCCGAARRRCRSTRCGRWPRAGSSTRSAAASRATRSTPPGPCPTSRRCSTTTRCWRRPTCTASRRPATRCCGASPRRRSTGCCARCAARRAASTARWTRTPRASRASSTSGPSTSCARRSGDDADAAIAWFGATARGNFHEIPGANVLEARGPEPEPERARPHPRRGCWRCARSACARASTTSAWRPGTR